MFKKKFIVTS